MLGQCSITYITFISYYASAVPFQIKFNKSNKTQSNSQTNRQTDRLTDTLTGVVSQS